MILFNDWHWNFGKFRRKDEEFLFEYDEKTSDFVLNQEFLGKFGKRKQRLVESDFQEAKNENIDILPDYINIDGEKYSTKNSNGDFIAKDSDSIINFYKWFGNSKTVDSKQRPLVFYHVSNSNFNEFTPSKFGKMGSGIYFTSIYNDIKIHNKYGGSSAGMSQTEIKAWLKRELDRSYLINVGSLEMEHICEEFL